MPTRTPAADAAHASSLRPGITRRQSVPTSLVFPALTPKTPHRESPIPPQCLRVQHFSCFGDASVLYSRNLRMRRTMASVTAFAVNLFAAHAPNQGKMKGSKK